MKRLSLALLAALVLPGCANRSEDPVGEYIAAEQAARGVILSPAQEKAAIDRFRKFFGDVTAESVPALTSGLYAGDAFFNDSLKTIRGREAIEAYFLKMTKHTEFVRAEVVDVARSGNNYYLRWIMDVRFKGSNKTIRTIGMTQLEFDESGRIILHQDFWDSTAGFFEHMPVIGPAIRWIKSLL